MTKVTIDRELLEQVASEFEHDNDRYMLGRELRKILDAPRQPEGEGLEVVGWYNSHAEVATSDKVRVVQWLPECIEPLCRLSDAQRAISELDAECCGLRKERDSLLQQAVGDAGYLLATIQQRDKLAGLLERIANHHIDGNIRPTVRDCVNGRPDVQDIYGYCDEIEAEICAALAEVNK